MRIAIFTDTFLPHVNGVVRTIVTTANTLVARGHEVGIFTINLNKVTTGSATAWQLDPRVQIKMFPSMTAIGFPDIQWRYPTILPTLRALRRFGADVMHCHTCFNMGWEAIAVAKLARCPLVGTHHGFLADYMNNIKLDYPFTKNLMRRYMAGYYNCCNVVTTPCEALARELLDYRLKREVKVIANPMNFAEFGLSASKAELRAKYGITKPTLVHYGRLVPQKSIDRVLQAFAALRAQNVDAELWVIGEGIERDKLKQLIHDLQLADSVKMLGLLTGTALNERVAACDMFVSASTTEAQPLVYLEAMILGIPAIGVAAGGVPEVIRHEHTGLVVEPHNSGALAAAMRRLIDNPEEREQFGVAARHAAQAFQAERVVTRFEELYAGLADRRECRAVV